MIYMDNSATTAIYPEVLDAMMPYLREEYGNPSSKYYTLASNSKLAVEEARQKVAYLLGCEHDEIVFTSGATESNNMIIKGVLDYYNKNNGSIVTSSVEHPSVLETCNYLQSKGISVTYLAVDNMGRVSLDDIILAIKKQPTLLSVIWGNNEVGSLNPIETIASDCDKNGILFHTDATQVVGKVEFQLSKIPGIRFLSLSGHKLHAPKGIGVAYIKKQTKEIYSKITPLLHGGGQENNYRSGTLAVHNIVGLGKAAEVAKLKQKNTVQHLLNLEKQLTILLKEKFHDKIKFNNDHSNKIPGILSIQFIGLNNELLIKKLAPYLAISTGSACSSSKPSHVLQEMGLPVSEIRQTLRISLSAINTTEDISFFNNL
ncbi:cysteine desulfurase family protein [Paenibacillus hexagrammi]|uniref:Cysteine desulfurase n=1 Tax=Paenibacillus hexagrammi TaxID=2908839 RepID=A0ABY3SF81_9BACL|nr:cysteine desulfurase family protein [Paenibacillus sp. YPD9-1]UJF32658.1 cysteine desulfurase [Paenibacillus sp. YPD9-1]